MEITGIMSYANDDEKGLNQHFTSLLKSCPIPEDQLLSNLGLFLTSKNLARIKFMDFIYQKIINVHGVVFDLGTRWGQNMAIFAALRGIYEPFNRHRKIVGFDTFSGFPALHENDGKSELMEEGNVSCTEDYQQYLHQVMDCQEQGNPASHIKKYEIISGDASLSVLEYLESNPETVISLAYFDFDIYKPTRDCLALVKNRLTKGSIVAFDELCDHDSPGETVALDEIFGIGSVRLKRLPFASRVSYMEIE